MSEVNQVEENVSALDAILEERDNAPPEPSVSEESIDSPEREEPKKKVVEELKAPKDKEENKLEKESAEKPDPKPSIKKLDEDDDYQDTELAKLKKALNDSQKWGHTNNKRLKSAIKMVNSLKDQGALTDDEFSQLHELLHSDEQEEQAALVSNDPLVKMIQSAHKRLSDLQTIYEEDPLFMKKAEAFDFFVNHCSEREREELLEELEEFEGSDLKLAKKMFKIGEKYYEENYKELDEAGGLKELVSLKNVEIEKMKRKLDKLERKLAQYDDYDKPTFKIDELGETDNVNPDKPGSVLDALEEERDRKKG